jgi:two-component system chemotaxis response regulator CheY
MKALIAEDDLTSRLLLQSLLASHGRVHAVANGREAVEAFKQAALKRQPFDLICLDIMMPEMDGQTALREIRILEESTGILPGNGVKILMTTALGDAKNVFTAFRELCDGYLVKPIDKGKLLGHLKAFGFTEK